MALHRSHSRWIALLCLFGASLQANAVQLSPLSSHLSSSHLWTLEDVSVPCHYQIEGQRRSFTERDLQDLRYSPLPAGDYKLHVNCDSAQTAQPQLARSSVMTASASWWQTWWTRIGGTGGIALLLWGLLWYRQRREWRQNERLERAVAERNAELARANRELQEASLSDPLTGIRNRRFFQSTIAADASQAVRAYRGSEIYSRDHRDLIFFLIDLDHFKQVNDEYGHDAGDRVLVQVAQRLSRVVRESDFLIRWGGEEFLVLCRAAERNDGPLLAARILKAINGVEFDLGNDRRLSRSCSVGWAAFPWLPPACSDLSVDEVLRLADRGLYLAKQGGRNQSVGLIPTTNTPVMSAPSANATGSNPIAAANQPSNLLTRPEKYCRLEQLLEDKLIREVRTAGEIAAAVAG
ncbi:MAG: diguanylate cyclase [Terriglobales bacterium]